MEFVLLLHPYIKKMARLKIVLLFAWLISSFCFAQTNKKKAENVFTISGKVSQTFAYCGGSAPSKEMLDDLKKAQPYAGKFFYVRKGSVNTLKQRVILSFKADTNGNFSFQLPPGIYSIIQQEQLNKINEKEYNKKGYIQTDMKCLKDWWVKPYYVLEIKDKNVTDLHFKFYHPCFVPTDIPCMQYIGPMPP